MHQIEFPSIYLEYLIVNNLLKGYLTGIEKLEDNTWHIFNELAKSTNNPLDVRLVDPANSANILSDLLTQAEKNKIISTAKATIQQKHWDQVVW